jgi:DUF1365 family protein
VVRSALYTGTLIHARRDPRENVFRYPVCFYLLDLDELADLDRTVRLLSVNRRGVVTFRDADHLGDPRRSTKDNVQDYVARHGVDLAGGRVLLLTNLRVLGYVFNPVSFYYCYAADGELACIVAEVSNTFGEMLPYMLDERNRMGAPAGRTGERPRHAFATPKRMHVSPFFPLEQEYRFFLSEPGERVHARVDVWQEGSRKLGSVLAGEARPLTDAALASVLIRYPLMPHRVTALIHWQALKLWRKGARFHHKPAFNPSKGSVQA